MRRRLSLVELRELRARAQGLLSPLGTPTEVLRQAMALQGQDLPAVLRAIALRSGATVSDARRAFDDGRLVRGWPMRGTLFALTPRDLAALSSLTAERVLRAMARRRAQLGVDEVLIERAWGVAEPLLDAGGPTRSELLLAWEEAGVRTGGGHGYHLLVNLSLKGRMSWGPIDESPSGVLEQRLVRSAPLDDADRDRFAVLARVARAYLTGRGPASVADLAWWLKLPKRDATAGIIALGDEVTEVEVNGDAMVVLTVALAAFDGADRVFGRRRAVHAVPAFDEWILGYQDRRHVASPRMQQAIVPGNNGIFRPAVLVDGEVVGTWKGRTKSRLEPEVELVETMPKRLLAPIARACAAAP